MIGMALFRDHSILKVVRHLDLVLPRAAGRRGVSGSAIAQPREASRPAVRWRTSRPTSSSWTCSLPGDDQRSRGGGVWLDLAGTIAAISLGRRMKGVFALRVYQPATPP
jgi:hypothetical protein